MFRRPRPGEEDLEQMKREFEESPQPASVVVNKRKSMDKNVDPNKKSRSVFARKRDELRNSVQPGKDSIKGTGPEVVLSDIQERVSVKEAKPPTPNFSSAFPDIIKLEETRNRHNSKASLFSQQFGRIKQSLALDSLSSELVTTDGGDPIKKKTMQTGNVIRSDLIGEKSFIIEGSGLQTSADVEKLHQENVVKLKSMSEEEILAEQSRLFQSLDPKLIEFLVKKRDSQQTVGSARPQVIPASTTELSQSSGDADALKQYPSMNVEEPEKKEWMMDIPEDEIANISIAGHSARFGFDGSLLDPHSEIDVQSGLHHHGEEPGRAGYTLGELFTLARSSNARQRVVALDILTGVLDKFWSGLFDRSFSLNPVEEMIRSGLVSLLRCSMDEGEESVVYSATLCLANLIAPQGEESALDLTSLYSLEQPNLSPEIETEEREEEEELKDHELVQLDLVQGLLRMDLLPRIRYILTVLRPGPGIVLAALRILIRISRHSYSAAKLVTNCSGLMQTILVEFLPARLPHTFSQKSLHGAPVWLACKLCRIISSWNSELANFVYQNYHLGQSLIAYLTFDPMDVVIPTRESFQLCIESYRTLSVLLRHNLATQQFTDLYPVFVRLLLYLAEKMDIPEANTGPKFDMDVGSWLLTMLSSALGCTDSNVLNWSHVENFRTPVETCCRKWLVQISRTDGELPASVYNLLGACLSFLSAFHLKLKNISGYSNEAHCKELEERFSNILKSLYDSEKLQSVYKSIADQSSYLAEYKEQQRSPDCLPSPGSVLHSGYLHPILHQHCPTFFVASLNKFVSIIQSVGAHTTSPDRHLVGLKKYLQRISVEHLSLVSNWFSRYEGRMLFWIVSNAFHSNTAMEMYTLSTVVCGLLQRPDEILVREIMEKVIFSRTALQSDCLLTNSLNNLSIEEATPLISPSNLPKEDVDKILKTSIENIECIKETYFTKLLDETICRHSLAVHNLVNHLPKSLTYSPGTVLPQDWPYYPLLEVFNQDSPVQKSREIPVEDLRNCLTWLLLSDSGKMSLPEHNTAKYYRLATVLLSGNDLFLDPTIHTLLSALLYGILHCGIPDLSLSVPGLTSGHDLYLQLLDQFQAVSYGDQLFSLFIVIPLCAVQPVAFRRTLLTEKSDVLRVITLKKDQLPDKILQLFVKERESHVDILLEYFKALMEKKIMPVRNDLLFFLAVRSVRTVCQAESLNDEEKKFKNFLLNSKMDESLRKEILDLNEKP